MRENHAQYLVDPITKSRLALTVSKKSGDCVVQGRLVSAQGETYPIVNGIPRFVSATSDPGQRKTARVFSNKWRTVPSYGKDESTGSFYRTWFLQRYGFRSESEFRQLLKGRKCILDAGTGLGRDAFWFAGLSQGTVFAIDLADTIELAPRNAPELDNLCFVQGDLSRLPFRRASFDFISCDQVIHHTKSSSRSFSHLVRHLAPGGSICVYVYKKKGPVREFCDDYLRAHLTSCSEDECWEFSKAVTEIGKELTSLHATIRISRDIPLLGLRKGRHDVQRLLYWHFIKCFWNPRFSYSINVAHNYDWYRPHYAHRHTPEEVRGWFERHGLRIDHFDVCDSGISARGHFPRRKNPR